MDRRGFLTAFFGAAAGLALTSGSAAALTLATPAMPTPARQPEDALLREHDEEEEARIEKARVVYRRGFRPRRRVVVRRPRYRYRRVYRPRYYYRPRPYWGPRVYRRRVWW